MLIIGLIVGSVLVGQVLIKTAEIRATISQIDTYQAAVHTFQTKFNAIPGDMNAANATAFGFVSRAGVQGRGDGDGIINNYSYPVNQAYGWGTGGENLFFWEDLSASGLIQGNFNTATDAAVTIPNNASFSAYIPNAKLGNGNYVSVFTVGGFNYYQINNPVLVTIASDTTANPGLTVAQAYAMDNKMDDGLPLQGNVLATMSVSRDSKGHVNNICTNNVNGCFLAQGVPSAATASATTCYDTTTNQYSTTQNSGNGVNCALSFKFQ